MNANINWITPVRGNGGSPGRAKSEYFFHLSNQKSGGKRLGEQGAIRVSEKAMKHLRWIAGDRVMIGRDESHVYIKRTQTGGYCLSGVGGVKSAGKSVPCCIKTSRISFAEITYVNQGDFVLLDDGTVMIEATAAAI